VCVVRYRSLRRTDHESRGVLPTVMRRCVWSRNLKNKEAMVRIGPQRHGGDTYNDSCSQVFRLKFYMHVWSLYCSVQLILDFITILVLITFEISTIYEVPQCVFFAASCSSQSLWAKHFLKHFVTQQSQSVFFLVSDRPSSALIQNCTGKFIYKYNTTYNYESWNWEGL